MSLPLNATELIALAYFFALWGGYSYYAKYRAKNTDKPSLSRSLRHHRTAWAKRMLMREMRMTDASLLANQERVVGFFASTTLLLLAAVVTAITTSNQIAEITSHIPLTTLQSATKIEAKLGLLLLILGYAFFKVTWSLRQYGFAAVVIGSAPEPQEDISEDDRAAYAENLAKLMDCAGHDNNSCLRAYYFGLAVLCWLAGTLPFAVATTCIALVLFNRECSSSAVQSIEASYLPPEITKDARSDV